MNSLKIPRNKIRSGLAGNGSRVGLLGGSFNPAHDGHLHISRQALMRLGIDKIWWLVSPQNPLKSEKNMASFKKRFINAKLAATDSRIIVTDLEDRAGTRFTIDTLCMLREFFPENKFVWIMGADNLIEFPRWQGWEQLFTLVPIAVFDRAPYSAQALSGKAATMFAKNRLLNRKARNLADFKTPVWTFFQTPLHAGTATAIRSKQKTNF